MAPFDILAIHAGDSGQGIDEKSVAIDKGVQSDFIINGIGSWSGSIHKVCYNSSVSSSISGNLGDFSQLKLNSAFVKHYSNFEPIE